MVTRRNLQKMLIQTLFLVLFCFKVVSPVIITSPGMQRKGIGESCTFKWVVKGSFESYSVSNRSTGETGALSSNANHTRIDAKGIISLTILNVQLWDAGNYSLSINAGTSTIIDNGALLFVYGEPLSVLNQTVGSQPAPEGSSIELTCSVTSSSLPTQYRPKMHYLWKIGFSTYYIQLRNISSGPAVLPNGDLLTGYSFKNDGRTLVIDSVQYDDREIRCCGQEEGTRYECKSLAKFVIDIHYRPRVSSCIPPSKRFHADVGEQVTLSLNVDATPAITLWTWTFVNTDGVPTSLSPDTSQVHNRISFTLTLPAYYGVYTSTLLNSIGSTTETFQVLLPAPPETPSRLKVIYATHNQIALYWNCMWFNGRKQTVSVQIKAIASNIEIETKNATVADSCYNQTDTTRFQKNIRPETSYEASVWSTNELGTSDVVRLLVTTPKRFKFVVSSKTITIDGTEATIDFSALNGNVTYVSVKCCSESTGACNSHDYPITSGIYRVVYYDLPDGDVYLFNFVVHGGKSKSYYYLTTVMGIRVSRTGGDDDEGTDPLLIATSVLAVLLGITVLAVVGSLLFFLVRRRRETQPPPNLPPAEEKPQRELPKRPLPDRKSAVPVTKKTQKNPSPPADVEQEEMYEVADAPTSPDDDRFYMPLNEKPTRAKKNQYS